MEISPVAEKFVSLWGEMGAHWGVNRSVAQMHALFYLAPGPLNAEEIAASLGVARSNVSASLRELESWGLIRPVHIRGDRRQHFEALQDVWEMFRVILEERKRREINPSLAVLRECLSEAQNSDPPDLHTAARLRQAVEFFDVILPLYDELRYLPGGPFARLIKLRRGIRDWAGKARGRTNPTETSKAKSRSEGPAPGSPGTSDAE